MDINLSRLNIWVASTHIFNLMLITEDDVDNKQHIHGEYLVESLVDQGHGL